MPGLAWWLVVGAAVAAAAGFVVMEATCATPTLADDLASGPPCSVGVLVMLGGVAAMVLAVLWGRRG